MKKFFKNLAISLMALSVILGASSCSMGNSSARFKDYVDASFLEALNSMDILSLNYTLKDPEKFGVTKYNINFGDAAPKENGGPGFLQNLIFNLSYNYNDLTEEQKIIYDALKFNISTSSKGNGSGYYYDYLSGNSSVCSNFLIVLAEYNFYKQNDIDNYLTLLGTFKDYFTQIADYEKAKSKKKLFISDDSLDVFRKDCTDFINSNGKNILLQSFEERINEFKDLNEEQRNEYIEKNKSIVNDTVIPAYKYLMDEMEKLRGTGVNKGGTAGFSKGAKYYEYLAAAKTGSKKTVSQMKNMIMDKITECSNTMNDLEKKDPGIKEKLKNAESQRSDPRQILTTLQEKIKNDFPAAPTVDYNVKYVSEYMQDTLSPALYLTPPIDDNTNNTIYINNSEKYQNTNIFTTLAHEGYPGHLYQRIYFSSQNVDPIRKFMENTGYTEGWATYVEDMSYEYLGYDNDLTEYARAYNTYGLMSEAIMDISINYENKDYSWYRKLFDVNADEAALKDHFLYIINNPGIYLPYSVGYLEIMNMKSYAEQKLGNKFNLADFHKTVLDTGSVPLDIVWNKIYAYTAAGGSTPAMTVPGKTMPPENAAGTAAPEETQYQAVA